MRHDNIHALANELRRRVAAGELRRDVLADVASRSGVSTDGLELRFSRAGLPRSRELCGEAGRAGRPRRDAVGQARRTAVALADELRRRVAAGESRELAVADIASRRYVGVQAVEQLFARHLGQRSRQLVGDAAPAPLAAITGQVDAGVST